mmetsp:Transcript_487/g.1179  ORF Transcript_487/g.1179 Transcript_487/m.1179 type:complete len:232 (-) Transcript_487:20-715(-)
MRFDRDGSIGIVRNDILQHFFSRQGLVCFRRISHHPDPGRLVIFVVRDGQVVRANLDEILALFCRRGGFILQHIVVFKVRHVSIFIVIFFLRFLLLLFHDLSFFIQYIKLIFDILLLDNMRNQPIIFITIVCCQGILHRRDACLTRNIASHQELLVRREVWLSAGGISRLPRPGGTTKDQLIARLDKLIWRQHTLLQKCRCGPCWIGPFSSRSQRSQHRHASVPGLKFRNR